MDGDNIWFDNDDSDSNDDDGIWYDDGMIMIYDSDDDMIWWR